MKLLIASIIGVQSVTLWRQSFAFSVSNILKLGAAPSCYSSWSRISVLNAVETTPDGLDEDIEDVDVCMEAPENGGDIKRLREKLKTASMKAPSEETAKAVEKVLLQMVDEWHQNPNDSNAPTASDFYTAITAWSDSNSPETARRVGILFFEQEALFEQNCVAAKPTAEIVSTVLAAMSSSRERGADRRAWALLERVPQYGIEPTAEMYTFVIRSLARSKDRNSAERAEGVLKDAVNKFPPGMDENGNPTGMGVDSFNVVLTAWAKSGTDDGPRRAEELLVYMDQVHKENGESGNLLKPNVSSFTSLIDAYAQTNDWDGVSASERMLNRLLEQFLEEGDESLEPNVASWTIVISAWTRLARKNFNKCAEKADRLLRRMEELYQEGRTSVAPDVITYITVMNAHAADSKSPGNARKAQDILDEMNERYLDGEDDMKVSTKSIKVVIDAWIKTNDLNAIDQAEAVLEMYEDMDEFQEPIDDEIIQDIYRSMLFGFTKHKDPHRAEEYLREMVSLGLKPDCSCYDRVIEAYTQLNGPDSFERTCAVFELMEQCRKDGDVMPNERVYTSFIRALTKAKVKGLARKATTVLKKMNELHQQGNRSIKPTTFTYNAVLNACADSINDDDSDNMEAFKVAIGIFNDLRNDGNDGPDHVTFGNMLRCAALLPEGEQRDTVITSTFQLCCKTGFVNSYVIRDLQYACSNEELWRRLVKCPQGDVDCDELPASWKSAYERKQEKAFRRENDNRKAGGGGRGGRRPSFGGRPEKFSRERR